jgi:two-component system, OmpR family, sensor histidine kinase NblS
LLTLLKTLKAVLERWWLDFTLQTKLMAVATLVVSIVMSGLTFWSVNTIQAEARQNDTRFGSDLGLLLAANVSPLVGENKLSELAQFSQRFYSSTASIRYMIYADPEGQIFFGIPFSNNEVKNSLTIQRRIQLPEDFSARSNLPMVRQHLTPDGEVTDVFVPLIYKDKYFGVLALGTNPNPSAIESSQLTREITTAVFVAIWAMVILGAVFNALTITKPIRDLLDGVQNITQGNFTQRVDLPLGGEFRELMSNFNVMAERLQGYDEQNIQEMTAEKAKLDTLVSTIADGAILLAPDFQILLANSTAKHFFGWSDDIQGKNALYLLPPAIQSEITRPLYQIARGELREETVFQVVLAEPVKRNIRLLLNMVLGATEQDIRGIAMTIQDVTREVALNEAKSQFISNISHELRTPLFNIKSFIETLYEYGDALEPEQQREFLETANRETDRLTRLVNDVLDLSRLESGRSYVFDAVEMNQAIEQTLRTCQLNAKDRGISLNQDVEAGLPPVLGNYDLILQVFANLVGNALKFTKAGGSVTLRAYSLPLEPDHETRGPLKVRIEVIDTGIGIDKEDQEAIFDRFFRVENRVHTLEGTGLGLSIVRNIIERHHSQVQLKSAVGVGTTFWFDLMVFEDQTVAAQSPEVQSPEVQSPEVLSPTEAQPRIEV